MGALKIFLLAASVFLSACRPCKEAGRTENNTTADSVHVTETITEKSKTVVTPTAAATVTLPVASPCPDAKIKDLKPVTKRMGNASATAQVKDGVFTADCFCDTLAIQVRWQERNTEIFKQHLRSVLVKQNIVVAKTPEWAKILLIAAALAILILLILLKLK